MDWIFPNGLLFSDFIDISDNQCVAETKNMPLVFRLPSALSIA